MDQQPPIDRADTARANDDHDLIERMADEAGGGGEASRSGGRVATDVGTRVEVNKALNPDASATSATKSDDVQPDTGTVSDHEGAQRG
ncbi:hypothetical protein [Sphingomonas jatrophae]|uniref:Uncharacterized protein n=1 Tax=Sphingomonas jatrophae TaxID=1166337 RepID=A0A1I6LJI4_9SPHN|nr:hypothetical protein [Sphingomonas jatrophae]SFS03606.1 hypothetical protein SAMN05192580_2813 [Sphingomonas jatrophae]